MNKIDAASSSFWSARTRTGKEAGGLGLLERQRVKVWLRQAYEQIDLVGV